jgi:Kdo2-lipid IVA lauroyltransferase/acyltransferase
MDKLTYVVFRFFIFLFSLLPFRGVYILSDLLFPLVFHVIRYRRKIVHKNLVNSFPEKSEKEIMKITRKFYHQFCDVFLESAKSFTMTEKDVSERYRFINTGVSDALYDQGRPVICIAGHFNNWEWGGIAAGSQMKHRPVGFYKPLSNKFIDRYLQDKRIAGRSVLASITKTAETFQIYKTEPAIFLMIADQRPASLRFAQWMEFLNQDTPVLHGPEKYARINNYPVVYADIQKIKRGYYEIGFIMIEENPAESVNGSITEKFMKTLEQKIKENPQAYLWTHNRWKFSRPR